MLRWHAVSCAVSWLRWHAAFPVGAKRAFCLGPWYHNRELGSQPRFRAQKMWGRTTTRAPLPTMAYQSVSWPVRPFGWDLKDQWRACWRSAATVVFDEWLSVSSYVGGTVARSRSKRTGGIWFRVAHVCLRIDYDIWQFCWIFGSAPYCNQFWTKLLETFKNR